MLFNTRRFRELELVVSVKCGTQINMKKTKVKPMTRNKINQGIKQK